MTPDAWYYTFVETVAEMGLFSGNDDGTFAPGSNAIRAEVAVTMVQMARVMADKDLRPRTGGPFGPPVSFLCVAP